MERMTSAEFKKKHNISSARKARTVYKDYGESEILQQTVASLPDLSAYCADKLFAGLFGIAFKLQGKTKADYDNITKGVLDGLQGYAFENDRNYRPPSIPYDYRI